MRGELPQQHQADDVGREADVRDVTRRDMEWIAAAWQFPDDLRELGLPLNGAIGPAARRALGAILDKGAVPGVLRDVLSVDTVTSIMGIEARPYRELLEEAPHSRGGRAAALDGILLSAADIFAPLPPVNWTCEKLDVAPGAPLLVAGYGFSGKTVALQEKGIAVASGRPAWDRFPVRTGRVLHIDYEQGSYLTRLRYQRLAAGRGIDPRSIDGRLVLAPMPGWYIDDDDQDDALARLADGFDLGIIDSFRAACPRTDENSSEARVPLDRLTRISEKTGITWAVIHHARKPSDKATGGARMSVRGSGALYDACGSCLVFAGEKGEPIAVEHEKARITGRTHEAFQLWIEDVEVGGDPRGGLRVSVLDSAPPAKQSGTERLQEVKANVLDFVRGQGGATGGLNVVCQYVGGRRDTVRAAIAELVRVGLLVRGGTTQDPTLSLSGTT
jgi:hypothetical protein